MRVLSIQSHVVSGYVGNKAAVFPMQLLGFEVDFINSVQFSNHTGYPTVQGPILEGNELDAISNGLFDNDLMGYDYFLTGYIGSESFLNSILKVWDRIRQVNPKAIFLCDPVLGDDGNYYVHASLKDIYKLRVLPAAFVITPNQFEAEELTGLKIVTEADACNAMARLHSLGPRIVAITSSELQEKEKGALHCLISYPIEMQSDGNGLPDEETSAACYTVFQVETQLVEGHYTGTVIYIREVTSTKPMDLNDKNNNSNSNSLVGTGDMTAALLLAWLHHLVFAQPPPPPPPLNSTSTSVMQGMEGLSPIEQAMINVLSTVNSVRVNVVVPFKHSLYALYESIDTHYMHSLYTYHLSLHTFYCMRCR